MFRPWQINQNKLHSTALDPRHICYDHLDHFFEFFEFIDPNLVCYDRLGEARQFSQFFLDIEFTSFDFSHTVKTQSNNLSIKISAIPTISCL